ncbi:protein phosphatase [Streptomyces sp. CC53]|nr:protein phosphatase [Streptomyces sp. CC53]
MLEQAVGTVGTALDERTTCEELAGFLHRHVCDAVLVELAADTPGTGPAGPAALRVSAGPGRLLGHRPPATDLTPRVPDDGQPVLLPGGPPYALLVPLTGPRGRYGSALALRERRPFAADDVAVARFAARLAAAHVGHARAHARVRDTAMHLQRALLAEPGRPHPNLDLATRYLPAGGGALVGGDWFETVRLHYGRTLLVIGDVMGHGIDAAVDMNLYRSMLRYIASTDLPPHRILRQLDSAVTDDGTRRPATCLLARVDPARGAVAFAGAGHLPPVAFAPDGTGELVSVPVGPPLGTGLGGYEMSTRRLAPGETLLMFTDGLVERRGEDIDDSLARLAGLRLPAGGTVQEVVDDVLDRLDAVHAEDDVAALAVRARHRPGVHLAGPPL